MSSYSPDLFLFLLLVFLILTNISTAIRAPTLAAANHQNTAVASDNNETEQQFIKTSCDTTLYPDLCYTSLSTYASKIKTSPKELAITALIVTLNATKASSDMMDRLSKSRRLKPMEKSAMEDCLELLGDSVDLLENSITEMKRVDDDDDDDTTSTSTTADSGGGGEGHRHKSFKSVMSDVQTWVSAALTDDSTCMDGFDEIDSGGDHVRDWVRDEITKIEHLTSNALALINNCVTSTTTSFPP